MAADPLEVDHHVCQVFILDRFSSSLVGNGPVLAEDTAEIAVREKDGARSIFAHQRHLFAKMGLSAKDHGFGRSPTDPSFAFLAIHPALPRTELTILEYGVGLLDPLSEFTLSL